MPTQAAVRRIALSLPGAFEESGHFSFSVTTKGKPKHFVWVWRERIAPNKPRVPNPKVVAIRVANEIEKASLLGADPTKFFTEPHYNGYPAVLVRLDHITEPELRSAITEAWRCVAPGVATKPGTVTKVSRPPDAPPRARARAAKPATRTTAAKSSPRRKTK